MSMQPADMEDQRDRRHWHLDKTLNLSHVLITITIAASAFSYANSMEKRVSVLEEKVIQQGALNARAQEDLRDLTREVKDEIRLLRADLMKALQRDDR